MAKAPDRYTQNVFINCPFDGQYKPLFDAAVFVVKLAGFEPRCALEASDAGQNRLQKIMDIIADCQYGFHDISRTEPGTYQLPRFCRRYGAGRLKKKKLLVVDRKRHRYQRFISDIAGQDVESHGNSPSQLVRCIRDWLSTASGSPSIPGGAYIYTRYRAFRRDLPALCARMKLNPDQLTFADLFRLVRIWLEENVT